MLVAALVLSGAVPTSLQPRGAFCSDIHCNFARQAQACRGFGDVRNGWVSIDGCRTRRFVKGSFHSLNTSLVSASFLSFMATDAQEVNGTTLKLDVALRCLRTRRATG